MAQVRILPGAPNAKAPEIAWVTYLPGRFQLDHERPGQCTGNGSNARGLEAKPSVGYGALVLPLIVAGVGISMVFPTVANAVVGSVPITESGVAAGTNNTVRESGGVFGVAILSAVFAANGGYQSAASFMHGFKHAEFIAAAAAAAGALVAVFAPNKAADRRRRSTIGRRNEHESSATARRVNCATRSHFTRGA